MSEGINLQSTTRSTQDHNAGVYSMRFQVFGLVVLFSTNRPKSKSMGFSGFRRASWLNNRDESNTPAKLFGASKMLLYLLNRMETQHPLQVFEYCNFTMSTLEAAT